MKILFPGSFDPFTIGHANVVGRALALGGEIVIAVTGDSVSKSLTPAGERVAAIRRLYAEEPRVSVIAYQGLTVDTAREEGADFILKGVRSVKDYEFERAQAEINRRLSGIETLLLPADPALAEISSTVVRELRHYGKDVSEFLPKDK